MAFPEDFKVNIRMEQRSITSWPNWFGVDVDRLGVTEKVGWPKSWRMYLMNNDLETWIVVQSIKKSAFQVDDDVWRSHGSDTCPLSTFWWWWSTSLLTVQLTRVSALPTKIHFHSWHLAIFRAPCQVTWEKGQNLSKLEILDKHDKDNFASSNLIY